MKIIKTFFLLIPLLFNINKANCQQVLKKVQKKGFVAIGYIGGGNSSFFLDTNLFNGKKIIYEYGRYYFLPQINYLNTANINYGLGILTNKLYYSWEFNAFFSGYKEVRLLSESSSIERTYISENPKLKFLSCNYKFGCGFYLINKDSLESLKNKLLFNIYINFFTQKYSFKNVLIDHISINNIRATFIGYNPDLTITELLLNIDTELKYFLTSRWAIFLNLSHPLSKTEFCSVNFETFEDKKIKTKLSNLYICLGIKHIFFKQNHTRNVYF